MKINQCTYSKLEQMLVNVGDMSLKARVRQVVRWLDIQVGDKVLDCGCADGFFLKALGNLYPKASFWGMDIDQKAMRRAKKEVGKNVKIIAGDVSEPPFGKNYFDKVVMSEVLEHLPDDLMALKKVFDILKKGGTLVLTVPNANYPFCWDPVNWVVERIFDTHVKSGFWAGIWNQHLRLYKVKDVEKVCQKAGFEVEDKKVLTHYCLPFNHILIYFFKSMLLRGKVSKNSSNVADKFNWEKGEKVSKWNWVKLGFKFINWVNGKNRADFSLKKSSVCIALRLKK